MLCHISPKKTERRKFPNDLLSVVMFHYVYIVDEFVAVLYMAGDIVHDKSNSAPQRCLRKTTHNQNDQKIVFSFYFVIIFYFFVEKKVCSSHGPRMVLVADFILFHLTSWGCIGNF
jgi:hypothetical protein